MFWFYIKLGLGEEESSKKLVTIFLFSSDVFDEFFKITCLVSLSVNLLVIVKCSSWRMWSQWRFCHNSLMSREKVDFSFISKTASNCSENFIIGDIFVRISILISPLLRLRFAKVSNEFILDWQWVTEEWMQKKNPHKKLVFLSLKLPLLQSSILNFLISVFIFHETTPLHPITEYDVKVVSHFFRGKFQLSYTHFLFYVVIVLEKCSLIISLLKVDNS